MESHREMTLFLGGVRGSFPTPGIAFARYGGDTSSFMVEHPSGGRIVIDAGTGVRAVGERLMSQSPDGGKVLMLFTHYHLDHVVGLPTFGPLSSKPWSLDLAGPGLAAGPIDQVLGELFSPPFWPIPLTAYPAALHFTELDGDTSATPLSWGGMTVRWCPVDHAGGCVAYRVDAEDGCGSVVIATDIEWGTMTSQQRDLFLHLCRNPQPADVLLMDGHFRTEEIADHRGWGHSSIDECSEVAQKCGVGRLVITHLSPSATDDQLDVIDAELRWRNPIARIGRGGDILSCRQDARQQ